MEEITDRFSYPKVMWCVYQEGGGKVALVQLCIFPLPEVGVLELYGIRVYRTVNQDLLSYVLYKTFMLGTVENSKQTEY